MTWHGIVPLTATTEINHLTTTKMPRNRQSIDSTAIYF